MAEPDAANDVIGPFTGPTHHYVVDRVDVPMTNTQAREFGGDLNGDKIVDNQLGMVISTLVNMGDGNKHVADMVASHAIASSVDIVADDLANDDSVSVVYHGADGDAAVPVGGRLVDGVFRSNRTATTAHPGRAIAKLPVFVDADASTVEMTHVEIDLQADGSGGFDGYVHGTVDPDAAAGEAYASAQQMLDANPTDHIAFMAYMDASPHDWVMTQSEFTSSSLVQSLFYPDVTFDHHALLSIGFRVHLLPCDGGCTLPAPVDRCHDRALDQDETGIDCGGATCGQCPAGQACTANADCLSEHCSSAGVCEEASCTDGVKDGFEPEVDCGGSCDAFCKVGEHCYEDDDCPANSTCGAPCTSLSCPIHLDVCR